MMTLSLALQLSSTYNSQNALIGESDYNGTQLSSYLNLYQQEFGKNKEENSFKVGASCQLDSVNENLIADTPMIIPFRTF